MDVGFIILCPDRRIGGLKNTLGSIRCHSYNREAICVVGDDTTDEELKSFKQICETHKGDNTITSLINTGMKKLRQEWACLLFSGSRIPSYIEWKFSSWIKDEKDVLFPVVDRKHDFITGSLNGVVINRRFFEEVGNFPTVTMKKHGLNDFEFAKMFWAIDAIEKGCKFKAIVGMRVI
jgi:hypothetical protein